MNLAVELARTGEGAKAGPIGLAVILLLCIACYFLFKSMSKHMKKVREEFPTDPPRAATTAGSTPAVSTVKAQVVPTRSTDADPPAEDRTVED